MNLTSEKHTSGKDKVDVYKWSIQDSKGRLEYISKHRLKIDHNYQRDNVSNARVNDIARDWSWMACGVVAVAFRKSDSTHWVFDGQHRVLAALKRSDINDLPCVVFDAKSIPDEAQAFLKANTTRGPVRKIDAFKALLLAGDDSALWVQRLVNDSGYSIGQGASRYTVSCVGTLMTRHKQDASLLSDIWGLCLEIFDGETITNDFVDALFILELHCREHSETIIRGHNRAKLLAEGRQKIGEKMAQSAAFYGKGGSKIKARGIVSLLNHGRRSRLIPAMS